MLPSFQTNPSSKSVLHSLNAPFLFPLSLWDYTVYIFFSITTARAQEGGESNTATFFLQSGLLLFVFINIFHPDFAQGASLVTTQKLIRGFS